MTYSLIHRTGLSRGRVYDHAGNNITELPQGAGNEVVGPWFIDYSTLFGGNTNGLGGTWDMSGIIMDGRALVQGTAEDDNLSWADFDIDERMVDRASIVSTGTTSARLRHAGIRLHIIAPNWEDGEVWDLSEDGTYVDVSPYDEWLDLHDDYLEAADDRIWHPARHAIRCPILWAVYRIKLGPNYESLAQMIVENTATVIGQSAQLAYGPLGMLTALHGTLYAAGHASRLYEPNIGITPVARGMKMLTYDGAHLGEGAFPEDNPDYTTGTIDGVTFGIIEPIPPETSGPWEWTGNFQQADGEWMDSPSNRARGRVNTLYMNIGRDVTARPGEVLVWHAQTAPVRLHSYTPAGGGDHHYVVGNTASPFYGPPVRLVYHECGARFTSR